MVAVEALRNVFRAGLTIARFLVSCSFLIWNYTCSACAVIVFVLTSWLNVGASIFPMMLCSVKHAQAWITFAHYIRTCATRIATWWKKHTSTL